MLAKLQHQTYIQPPMPDISIQLQGPGGESPLLLTLLGAIVLVLVAYGARMAAGRRWGTTAACGAVALGIVAVASTLLVLGVTASGAWMSLVGAAIVAAVGVFYAAVYHSLSPPRIAVLLVLRSLGILALLAILFKPAVRFSPPGSDARPYLPVLLDRSGSMATIDRVDLPDRYTQAVQMLALQRARLDERFRVVWGHFAESVRAAESLDELSELAPATAGGTDLEAAIRSGAADYDLAELPGIVVVTDGIHNAPGDAVQAAVESGVPIYPVAVGSLEEVLAGRGNIEIVSADCPFEAVKNNVATITCRVKMTGLATVGAEVRLLGDGGDRPLDTARLWTDKNVETLTVRLKWTPRDTGAEEGGPDVRTLRLAVTPNPAETVTDDNRIDLHVLVTAPRIRVLYVEGSMRPEFKFLRRLLDSDPNVQFMALIRIAGRRFLVQGGVEGKQLRAIPARPEEFALFDVILLGDLDRTFLTRGQLEGLRRFVNDGGGLVMLGGHNSFGPGGYGGTDVEQVLPVEVGPRTLPQETTPLLPQLTAAGRRHPIFEGIVGYFPGPGGEGPDPDLARLPELLGCVTVVRAKPAAQLLAVHPTRSNAAGPLVVLAVQRFGAGRTAAFTADTTWQWFLPLRALGAEGPYQRFWGQLVRWLANVETKTRKTPGSVVMRLDRQYTRVGSSVRIVARVRDERARTPRTANVSATVGPADGRGSVETVPLSYRPGSELFEADFTPKRQGRFVVAVLATDGQGALIGGEGPARQLPLVVAPQSAETERLARNDALLQQIADRSGGRFVRLSALPDLVDRLIERGKVLAGPVPQVTIYRLYNFVVLFVAFAVLITAEWLLRRNWQLH